ncbi:hypothetical protein M8494_26200, partial [Serratia ureilytica]
MTHESPARSTPTGTLSWWTPRSTGVNHMKALATCMKEQGSNGVRRQPDGAAAYHPSDSAINYQKQALPEHAAGGRQVRRGDRW